MGGFYGTIAVRTEDLSCIQSALATIWRRTKTQFLVAPPKSGWIAIYPSSSGQDDVVSRRMARLLPYDLIQLISHDEDVFLYSIYRGGRLVDRYSSDPAWENEGITEAGRRKLRGRPERYQYLCDGSSIEAVRKALQVEADDVFSSRIMTRFAEVLRLPLEVMTSYDYLMDGETDEVEDWDSYIHIPDRSAVIARRRERESGEVSALQRLLADRVLLSHLIDEQSRDGHCHPVVCRDRDGRGFLVARNRVLWDTPLEVETIGPPWSAGPIPAGLSTRATIADMVSGPSRRYLAMPGGGPGRRTTIWDCELGEALASASRDEFFPWVEFTPDESRWVGIGRDKIATIPLAGDDNPTFWPFASGECPTGAIHPTEPVLVVAGANNYLSLIHLETGQLITRLLTGGPSETTGLAALALVVPGLAQEIQDVMARFDLTALERSQSEALANRERTYEVGGLAALLAAPPFDRTVQNELWEALAGMKSCSAWFDRLRRSVGKATAADLSTQHDKKDWVSGAEAALRLRFDDRGRWLFAATDKGVRAYRWRQIVSALGSTPQPEHSITPDPYIEDPEADPLPEVELKYDLNRRVFDLAYDTGRSRLLFATMGGQVGYLDPEAGRQGILVEPPGRPTIFRIELSGDYSALCCVCHPKPYGSQRFKQKSFLQVWDYTRLCRRLDHREEAETE